MNQNKVKVGIIGAGQIAERVHVPSFRLWPQACYISAVASRTESKARAFGAMYKIPKIYPDYQTLLDDQDVDAVVICVPSVLTATVAQAVLAAKKHVLCEKPLGLTFREAQELRVAAEESDHIHMVAFTFRFVPAVRYLKRLVLEGQFGEIRHWRLSYLGGRMLDPATPFSWRNDRRHAGSGVLEDMGSHAIDLARYLLGDIMAVCSLGRIYVRERPCPSNSSYRTVDAEDAYSFMVSFACGAIGTFDLNRAIAGYGGGGRSNHQSIEIYGTEGAAVFDLHDPFALRVSLGPEMTKTIRWDRVGVPGDLEKYQGSPRNSRMDETGEGYKLDQGVAFLKAIRGETEDYASFKDGAEAQQVVDAIEMAAKEGRWINLKNLDKSNKN